MIAVFWTDLDPSRAVGGGGGEVYTKATNAGNCLHGLASSSGDTCCHSMCGTCGGSGCQARAGGRAQCCAGRIRDTAVACSETGGAGPCVMDGQSFVVQWQGIPAWCEDNDHMQCAQLDGQPSTFQLILYASGEIKMQYQQVLQDRAANPAAKVTVGIENAAGSEG